MLNNPHGDNRSQPPAYQQERVGSPSSRDLSELDPQALVRDVSTGLICMICLEKMEDDKIHVVDGCGHRFHEACIARWKREKATCPGCRGNLPATGVLKDVKTKSQLQSRAENMLSDLGVDGVEELGEQIMDVAQQFMSMLNNVAGNAFRIPISLFWCICDTGWPQRCQLCICPCFFFGLASEETGDGCFLPCLSYLLCPPLAGGCKRRKFEEKANTSIRTMIRPSTATCAWCDPYFINWPGAMLLHTFCIPCAVAQELAAVVGS